jgi:hypothetical protein
MKKRAKWFFDAILIGLLSLAVSVFGEPMPQNLAAQTQTPASDDGQKSEQTNINSSGDKATSTAPSNATPPAQTNSQTQNQPSPQTESPGSVPTGAAGAQAAPAKGAPASRMVGSAIAPAKQSNHRALLIKVGVIAGACIAVGIVIGLSKASPSKPPGAQ